LPKGATVEAVPRTTGMSNRLLPTISPTGISYFQRIPTMAEVAMRSKRNHPCILPTTPSMVVSHTDTDAPILPGGAAHPNRRRETGSGGAMAAHPRTNRIVHRGLNAPRVRTAPKETLHPEPPFDARGNCLANGGGRGPTSSKRLGGRIDSAPCNQSHHRKQPPSGGPSMQPSVAWAAKGIRRWKGGLQGPGEGISALMC
jgi:hypothetical protein